MKHTLQNEKTLDDFKVNAQKLGLKVIKAANSLVIVDSETNGFNFQAIVTKRNNVEYAISNKSFVRGFVSREYAYNDILQTANQ